MFRHILVFLSSFVIVLCDRNFGTPAGYMSDLKPVKGLFFKSSEVRCNLYDNGTACVAAHFQLEKKKTQVVISGYLDSSSSPLLRAVADVYLRRGRNVIIVEIFPVLMRHYPLAARVTRPFGEFLGEFLTSLTSHGLTANRLELLGASLGAHIASYASHRFEQLTGSKPARLTGLDPAGPCFRNLPYSERLNRNAAQKVDVLHTNIDGFGIPDPLGHVDFYANGGEYQQSMKNGFILPCFVLCSHVRSALYWIDSYKSPDQFVGVQCDSVAEARRGDCYKDQNITTNFLGPKTDFRKPGIYYLPTNEASPYYKGLNSLKRQSLGINTYLLQLAPDEDMIL
ncbi:unnamed protein product [Diatraea saccharalis]|uniref:Lipase domain-containing protein n=1 Tax=Diatraea saccharalis TaxID=40085 RepID=A0A9N9R8M1_9NEOP|nr:unnamed protein product [Diatraea saccharalis]